MKIVFLIACACLFLMKHAVAQNSENEHCGSVRYIEMDTGRCVSRCGNTYLTHRISRNEVQCIPCESPCKTCVTASDFCASCINGYVLRDNKCRKIRKTKKCKRFRELDTGNCVKKCSSKYLPVKTGPRMGECKPCRYPCKSCRRTVGYCESCMMGYSKFAWGVCKKYMDLDDEVVIQNSRCKAQRFLEIDTNKCVKKCKQGYLTVETRKRFGECRLCDSSCKTCVTSTDFCDTCHDGYAAENGKCYRIHIPPKFNEECESGMYLEEDTGNCVPGCSEGYVASITDQVFGKCTRCKSLCKTCQGLPDFCTTCHYGYKIHKNKCVEIANQTMVVRRCDPRMYFEVDTGNCVRTCSEGYIAVETGFEAGECRPCESPCTTCVGTTYFCLSCIEGYALDKMKCQAISRPAVYYTRCDAGMFLTTDTNECVAVCDEGYLTVNTGEEYGECRPCKSPCATCRKNTDQCETCIEGYSLFLSKCERKNVPEVYNQECGPGRFIELDTGRCLTRCLDGYITKQTEKPFGECLPCYATCQTCEEDPSICTSCKEGYSLFIGQCTKTLPPYITKRCRAKKILMEDTNRCVRKCPERYLTVKKDGKSVACRRCDSSCKTCSGFMDTCTSCHEGYLLFYSRCIQINIPESIPDCSQPSRCKEIFAQLDGTINDSYAEQCLERYNSHCQAS